MFYWSFTSLVHFWPPPIFNPGYAYDKNQTTEFPSLQRTYVTHAKQSLTNATNITKTYILYVILCYIILHYILYLLRILSICPNSMRSLWRRIKEATG